MTAATQENFPQPDRPNSTEASEHACEKASPKAAATIIVSYRKNELGGGAEVVELGTVRAPSGELSSLEQFDVMFDHVPLFNTERWRDLSVGEITRVFSDASQEALELCERRRKQVIDDHANGSWAGCLWDKITGWKAPAEISRAQILEDMAQRCERLSDWMTQNQFRRFYMDSDMSFLIVKPREVAKGLRSIACNLDAGERPAAP